MCYLKSNLFIVGFVCDFVALLFFRVFARYGAPSISRVIKEIRRHALLEGSISRDMLGLYVGNIKRINSGSKQRNISKPKREPCKLSTAIFLHELDTGQDIFPISLMRTYFIVNCNLRVRRWISGVSSSTQGSCDYVRESGRVTTSRLRIGRSCGHRHETSRQTAWRRAVVPSGRLLETAGK